MARKPTPIVADAATTPAAAPVTPPAAIEAAVPPIDAPAPAATIDIEHADALIEVRILRDHGERIANEVALIDAADLDAAIEDGWADPHPDAVAYARGLSA